LNKKEDEIHTLNNQINDLIKLSEEFKYKNEKHMIKNEKKILDLGYHIGNVDNYVQKYQNNLIEIKNNFDLEINEYKEKLHLKDIEITRTRENYENEKYEVRL
jgi:hypothetical protein